MIIALMFDLGETLIHQNQVRPGVPECLQVLSTSPVDHGRPLELALVSDFGEPNDSSKEGLRQRFAEYVALVESFGLREYFEPVDRRITLSLHAGLLKPNRRVFELAMTRLGLAPKLDTAAFITEDADHIAACRSYGMKALQYGVDFEDWAEVPLRILCFAELSAAALLAALNLALEAKYGFSLAEPSETSSEGAVRKLIGVVAGAPQRTPVQLTLEQGRLRAVRVGDDELEDADAAARFARTLEANRQVAPAGQALPAGATHEAVTSPSGERVLKRRRFTLR